MNKLSIGLFASLLFIQITFSANAKSRLAPLPQIFYVNIPVQTADSSWSVSGQYRIPRTAQTQALPAVIIMHSSSGIDSTGKFYAKALNKAGIATLELDLWGARNLQGGSADRPASPQETLPDVFAAMAYLAQQPMIDAQRIGIIGFSWGGVLSMLTATEQYMSLTGSPLRFAGHVAHYPVCWLYNNVPGFEFNNLTGAPVLLQAGGLDDYDLPDTCPNMVENLTEDEQELVEVNVFNRAYHAWDRLEPTWVVNDPYAHLGLGGEVTLAPNWRVARKSRKNVVEFFQELFALEESDD
ncbi:dienelactone hydrolase family protein [Litorilituus sediminis]|uniref:Dienelactone hydrolase domain-containing protein n=1 Tax=Litorilituus sediminis TaxID=718192 RepID=A0A4P6P513_9GAMM|nr:dienelactone hydrolase family protein [Litorilituus sediminis]QBG36038.1 hypothetical protein EMK97_10125 [Litorilituus sediminis]